jgi:sodium-coupled neutral amino acid transporter 11
MKRQKRNSLEYSFLEDDESLPEELELEVFEEREEPIRSTVMDATFNFTNSIVGAGIIGLPYALKQSGLVTGLFLLGFLAYLVDYTVILLVTDGKLAGKSTYQGLIDYCFGNKGLLIVSVFQFIFAYGAMCAYTVILGDTIPTVFASVLSKNSWFSPILTSRSIMIILCTLMVSLPLSLYRDVSALAKTSAVSLAMICFIVFAVVVTAWQLPPPLLGNPELRYTIINDGIFQAMGVISFGTSGSCSIRLSSQYLFDLWVLEETNHGPIRHGHASFNIVGKFN